MNNLAIDPLWIWIAVGVVGLMIVVGLISRGARRARSESLRGKNCDEAQGFYFSRPVAPEEVSRLLVLREPRLSA